MKPQQWTRDSYYCSQIISEGLERHEPSNIERGLSATYDLFVDYLLEERHDDLLVLGRDLNAAYFPHRSETLEPFSRRVSYLGQVRALINLCDYLTQRTVPERFWQVISRSKYAKPIMQALQESGTMLATELCLNAGLPHVSQLQRTVQPLVDIGLVRREKFGKNVWYSLTSNGRLMASKHFGIKETSALESILPAVIAKLTTGWQSLSELVEHARIGLPNATITALVGSILTALQDAGIAEVQDGRWRIPVTTLGQKPELADISGYPELASAVHLIEKQYERIRVVGVADKNSVQEARDALSTIDREITADKTQSYGLQVRMTLEKAKCSALDADWQTAFALVGEAEAAARAHHIDVSLFDAELRSVWSYVEAVCIEGQLSQANRYIEQRDYRQARDELLTVFHILASSQSWNAEANLATELLRTMFNVARLAEASQREYEQVMEDSISQRQQMIFEHEELEACFNRWEPAEEFEQRSAYTEDGRSREFSLHRF